MTRGKVQKLGEAIESAKNEEIAGEGHNKPIDVKKLKALVASAKEIRQRQLDAGEDMKSNKQAAVDMGLERKDYAAMLREIFKPLDAEHKRKVDELLVAVRGLPLFDHAGAEEKAA
jgi:hypothetical protein